MKSDSLHRKLKDDLPTHPNTDLLSPSRPTSLFSDPIIVSKLSPTGLDISGRARVTHKKSQDRRTPTTKTRTGPLEV